MLVSMDGFEVDLDAYRLRRDGQQIALEPRTFDLLAYLARHVDRVVSKEELLREVWGSCQLSDAVLANAVSKLRRALAQGPKQDRPIETVHGRGYRLHASRVVPEPAPHARAAAVPASEPPTRPERDPFVGRAALLSMLLGRLGKSPGGGENVVVLIGEAGIGKTRTARELARRARERGVGVWTGTAYEGRGAPPYWPWTQILREMRGELGDGGLRSHLPAHAWAIRELVPELRLGLDARQGVEPDAKRFQLFDEVTQLLKHACAERPRLLVLDDLHWADVATVELLASAARALQEHPVLLLATLRSGELPAPGGGRAPLDLLGRSATNVPLEGLSVQEVQALLAALGVDPDASACRALALQRRTQGNPYFVRQTLDLVSQHGGWSSLESSEQGTAVPPTVQHVVRRRLETFGESTRRSLGAASVLGTTVSVSVLSEMTGVPVPELLDRLEPARRAGLLEVQPELSDRFVFAHVLARETLYGDLSVRERGQLHRCAAEVLAARGGALSARALGEIAYHRLRAVPFEPRAAVVACTEAAAAAREAAAFESAADLLAAALSRFQDERADTATCFRLLAELGEVQFYCGWMELAWESFLRATELARRSGRAELLAQVAPRLVDCVELGAGDARVARAVVEEALAHDWSREPALEAGLLAQRAELSIELAAAQRQELLDRAAALAERCAQPSAILEVAHSRATLRDPTRPVENARAADAFLALLARYPEAARDMRYRVLRRLGAHVTRYLAALTLGDLAAADAAFAQCEQLTALYQTEAARYVLALLRAGRAAGDGRLEDLQRSLKDLEQSAAANMAPVRAEAWLLYTATCLELQGERGAGAAAMFDARVPAREAPSPYRDYFDVARARLCALSGDVARARALLPDRERAALLRRPALYGDLGQLCTLLEVLAALEDGDGVAAVYELLLPYAGFNAICPSFEYRGAVARYLGVGARALGRSADAQRHYQLALEVSQTLNMPAQVSWLEAALAQA